MLTSITLTATYFYQPLKGTIEVSTVQDPQLIYNPKKITDFHRSMGPYNIIFSLIAVPMLLYMNV